MVLVAERWGLGPCVKMAQRSERTEAAATAQHEPHESWLGGGMM